MPRTKTVKSLSFSINNYVLDKLRHIAKKEVVLAVGACLEPLKHTLHNVLKIKLIMK